MGFPLFLLLVLLLLRAPHATSSLDVSFSGSATALAVAALDKDDSGNVYLAGTYCGGGFDALSVAPACNTGLAYYMNVWISSYAPGSGVRWTIQWPSRFTRLTSIHWDRTSRTLGIVGLVWQGPLTLGSWGTIPYVGNNFQAIVVRADAATGAALWGASFPTTAESSCLDSVVAGALMVVACFSRGNFTWGAFTVSVTGGMGDVVLIGVSQATGVMSYNVAFGGANRDSPASISLSLSQPLAFTVGTFASVSFPVASSVLVNADVSGATNDVFVVASVPATGALLWGRRFGSTGADSVAGVVALAGGVQVIAGSFTAGANTSFSPSHWTLGVGGTDVFALAFDEAAGSVLWVTTFGGSAADAPSSLSVDSDGNILLTGSYSASMRVGCFQLVNAGAADIFVAKLSAADGSVMWASSSGGPTADTGQVVLGMATANTFALAGSFTSPSIAVFGATFTTSGSNPTAFLSVATPVSFASSNTCPTSSSSSTGSPSTTPSFTATVSLSPTVTASRSLSTSATASVPASASSSATVSGTLPASSSAMPTASVSPVSTLSGSPSASTAASASSLPTTSSSLAATLSTASSPSPTVSATSSPSASRSASPSLPASSPQLAAGSILAGGAADGGNQQASGATAAFPPVAIGITVGALVVCIFVAVGAFLYVRSERRMVRAAILAAISSVGPKKTASRNEDYDDGYAEEEVDTEEGLQQQQQQTGGAGSPRTLTRALPARAAFGGANVNPLFKRTASAIQKDDDEKALAFTPTTSRGGKQATGRTADSNSSGSAADAIAQQAPGTQGSTSTSLGHSSISIINTASAPAAFASQAAAVSKQKQNAPVSQKSGDDDDL